MGPRDSVNGCGEEKNLLSLRVRVIFLFQFFICIALSSAPLVLPPQRSGVRFLGTPTSYSLSPLAAHCHSLETIFLAICLLFSPV